MLFYGSARRYVRVVHTAVYSSTRPLSRDNGQTGYRQDETARTRRMVLAGVISLLVRRGENKFEQKRLGRARLQRQQNEKQNVVSAFWKRSIFLELRALTVSVEGFFVNKTSKKLGVKHRFFKGQIEFWPNWSIMTPCEF